MPKDESLCTTKKMSNQFAIPEEVVVWAYDEFQHTNRNIRYIFNQIVMDPSPLM